MTESVKSSSRTDGFDSAAPAELKAWELDVRDDGHAAEFLRRAKRVCDAAQFEWRVDALQNIAASEGHQCVMFNREHAAIEDDPRFDPNLNRHLYRFNVNYMRRWALHSINRMTNSDVTWGANPRTDELDHADASHAAEKLLPILFEKHVTERTHEYNDALWQFFNTQVVFAVVDWSDEDDEFIEADEFASSVQEYAHAKDADRDEPMTMFESINGYIRDVLNVDPRNVIMEQGKGARIIRGEESLHFATGFDVFDDPSTHIWDKKRWVIVRYWIPLEEIKDKYGDNAKEIVGEEPSTLLDGEIHPYKSFEAKPEMQLGRSVHLYRMFFMPCEKYPKGWRLDMAENRILDSRENPHRNVRNPVIPIQCGMGRYWGHRPTGLASDLRQLQGGINYLHVSALADINQKATMPPIVETEALVRPNDFRRSNEAFTEVKAGAAHPEYLNPPGMPAEWADTLILLINEFKDFGGLTDVSVGKADSNAKTASGTAALIRQSDIGLTIPTNAWAEGMRKVAETMLRLWAQYRSGKNTFPFKDKDGNVAQLSFLGDSFVLSDGDHPFADLSFNIEVTIEPKLDDARVADLLRFLMEAGVVNGQRDGAAIFSAIMDRDISRLDRQSHSSRRAKATVRTIKNLTEGLVSEAISTETYLKWFAQSVSVLPTDQHDVHLEEITRYMDEYWFYLPPVTRELLSLVAEAHQQTMMQQAAAAAPSRGKFKGSGVKAGQPTTGASNNGR